MLNFFISVSAAFRTNLLQFAKKKRKRSDSGSDVDLDFVEREEKEDDDLLSDKRRSGRRGGPRKRYVDEVPLELDLSDEDEKLLMNLPPGMIRYFDF